MADVQIVMTDELPESMSCAAEFGPGFVHIAVRPGLDACHIVERALETMMDCYPPEQLERLTPSCLRLKIA